MTDRDCIELLQWAIPFMRLRWRGFRRVRGQVCKRISERVRSLGLPGAAAYRGYLERHPGEWEVLDRCCRITISRFYRDRKTFRMLEEHVLPELARDALARGCRTFACWSAGCASGEEPYSLAVLWKLRLQQHFPDLRLRILATDADEVLLERGRRGIYGPSSLKDLPTDFVAEAFDAVAGTFVLRERFRAGVHFLRHDLRLWPPDGPFDLVLCRNSVFTYFIESLQTEVLVAMRSSIVPGGALVIGDHESLPPGMEGLPAWEKGSRIFRHVLEQVSA